MLRMTASDAQTWIAGTNPITVVSLADTIVETLGYDPDSHYAETYWLPVIGPSALWALRRLNRWLDESPDGYPLVLGPFAAELGLGGTGRTSPVVRTLARLVCFELAEIRGGTLMVRRRVPPLARRHLQRLPTHLVGQHQAVMEAVAPRPMARASNIVAMQHAKVAGGQTGSVGEADPSARCATSLDTGSAS